MNANFVEGCALLVFFGDNRLIPGRFCKSVILSEGKAGIDAAAASFVLVATSEACSARCDTPSTVSSARCTTCQVPTPCQSREGKGKRRVKYSLFLGHAAAKRLWLRTAARLIHMFTTKPRRFFVFLYFAVLPHRNSIFSRVATTLIPSQLGLLVEMRRHDLEEKKVQISRIWS